MRPKRKSGPAGPVERAVRERFGDPWQMFNVEATNFYEELPSEAERRAFARAFPEKFADLFEFVAHSLDKYGTTVPGCFTDGPKFRRPLGFYKKVDLSTFTPPDLRGLKFPDRHQAMTEARGRWFEQQGLPMSDEERRWLRRRDAEAAGQEAKKRGKVVPMEKRQS